MFDILYITNAVSRAVTWG